MFEFRKIEKDDPLLLEIFKLRYKVYIEEWGFEKPEDHPYGTERDVYDDESVHFVALRSADQQVIGTIRIILDSEKGFPIEKHFVIDASARDELSAHDRRGFAEISRLAVSNEYRRRAIDKIIFEGKGVDGNVVENATEEMRRLETGKGAENISRERRRLENCIVMGLYYCIFQETIREGNCLTHLYAVMANGLPELLGRFGINFRKIGEQINYHGMRAPYVGNIGEMHKELASSSKLFAKFIADTK